MKLQIRQALAPTVLAMALFCGTSCSKAHGQSPPVPVPLDESSQVIDAIDAHMDYIIEYSIDEYGSERTPMWLSQIDIRTGLLPKSLRAAIERGEESADSTIDALRACADLYLDQPTLVAAHELGKQTGCKCFADGANAYIEAWFERLPKDTERSTSMLELSCYDVIGDEFLEDVELARTSKFVPAWELLWRESPERTAQEILNFARAADRLDDSKKPADRQLQQAIALESLCWLFRQNPNEQQELVDQIENLIEKIRPRSESSEGHGKDSDLRVASACATALARAAAALGDAEIAALSAMCLTSQKNRVLALLKRKELTAEQSHGTLAFGEACLQIEDADEPSSTRTLATSIADFCKDAQMAVPADQRTAEWYGRAIHFLLQAERELGQSSCLDAAKALARESIDVLYDPKQGMFRSRPGIEQCNAVDGPGLLFLALLAIEGDDATEGSALHF